MKASMRSKCAGRVAWGFVLALAAATPAFAARILAEFNYPFDQGGELHLFKAGEDSQIAWKAGGALGSIGCLKVTGRNEAIAESEVIWFRSGSSTISFHYYSHGFTRLRLRLNTAQTDDRQKFGVYSQNFFQNLPQDQWVFVQLKLADLKGSAPGNPAGYPELVFKSFTIFADPAGADSYLLLDNIRVGPPIEEKDIKVRSREKQASGSEKRVLLDFEDPAQGKLIVPLTEDNQPGDLTVAVSDKWASSGKKSLKLTAKAGKDWAAAEFDKSILKGWEKFDFLTFDMYSDDPRFVRMTLEFWDPNTKSYGTRCTLTDQPEIQAPLLHKGVTRFQIDLRMLRLNGKEAVNFSDLEKQDRIDVANMARVKFWFLTRELKEDYTAYMDNVCLVQEGALESSLKVALPKGALAFDFGEGSPVAAGFREASVIDVWEAGKDCGFVDPVGLRSQGFDWPDPLTGDFIGPAPGDDGQPPADASFEFRVKAADGKYRVWLCAGYFPSPDRYVDLNVNGKIEYSFTMTAKRFLSENGFFRFLSTEYSEKPNALWRDYVSNLYPVFIGETEVKDGVFYVKGCNSFISALILVPAAQASEFDKMAAQIAAERVRYFYKDLYLVRPPNEPFKDTDKDLALFAPADGRRIMPWSGTAEGDGREIARVAAPGETIAFQIGLRPFRDMANARLSVTDLQGPGQATIPSAAVEVYVKKYMSDGAAVNSWCLQPRQTVDLEKDVARSVWLRVRVPREAAAGAYAGAFTVTAGDVTRKLDLRLRVYPIRLRDDIPLAIGCFYGAPDSGQFAMFDRIAGFEERRDRMLSEQMEIMKDFGLTSVTPPGANVKGLKGSGVQLDFGPMAKVTAAAKSAGLLATPMQRAPMSMLAAARQIQTMISPGSGAPGDELKLKGFGPAYVSAVMQMQEWSRENSVPLVFWLVDEPRENPNPWNRTLEDTLVHCDLAGQVKGAIRMVTPMGDTQSGKDYTVMCDHLEIVDTHAGKSSEKLMARAMNSGGKLELWIYNVGADRLSNGFYLWRVGATGKHEWHFNQQTTVATGRKWPTSEPNVPFGAHAFNPYTVPAPLGFKGALLPMEGLMTMSIGANDYRYIFTLEQAIAACKAGKVNLDKAAEAEQFLVSLKSRIPVLPEVKNLADLAGVGEGLDVNLNMEDTRAKIAEFITALTAPVTAGK